MQEGARRDTPYPAPEFFAHIKIPPYPLGAKFIFQVSNLEAGGHLTFGHIMSILDFFHSFIAHWRDDDWVPSFTLNMVGSEFPEGNYQAKLYLDPVSAVV